MTLLVLSCSRCKEEEECFDANNPACENYDPCLSKQPISADFRMFAAGSFDPAGSEVLDGDTAWCFRSITFKTVQSGIDSVQWLIGSDPQIHRDLQFSINFSQPYYNVPVRCVVFGPQDEACFGSAYTSDTIVKHISLVHWPDLPLWTYRFRCHFSHEPTNEFDISFEVELDPGTPPFYPLGDVYIIGMNVGESCLSTGIGSFNHAFLDINSSYPPGCFNEGMSPDGSVFISPDKMRISGPWSINNPISFSGYRIN